METSELALQTTMEGMNPMVAVTEDVQVSVRERVSVQLESDLQVHGVAQAVVFLNPPAGAAAAALALDPEMNQLQACFVKDERSITASVAALGVTLGSASAVTRSRRARGTRSAMQAHRHARSPMAESVRSYADIPVMRTYPALGVVLGDLHADGLQKLAGNPRVRYVASSVALSLIRPIASSTVSLDPNTTTWGIERLGIPRLWQAGLDGGGIRVGHLDTGVDDTHPALQNAVQGYLLTDYDGFPVANAPTRDTGEHGTHTAGTIVGRSVGGRAIGVAPAADLHSATVIEGGNVVARILTGLNWAIDQGVKVVSLSLGLRGYQNDFHELLTRVRERGILPVIAVGNEGPGTSRSPGNYDNVLSVGAMNESGIVATFSSSQYFTRPDDPLVPGLVAPGVNVISAKAGGGYLALDGSSMATPHVAGLAALLWQARLQASVADIEAAIQNSCTLGAMRHDRGNRGLPNGPLAYQLLTSSALPPAARAQVIARKRAARLSAPRPRRPAKGKAKKARRKRN